MNEVTIREMDKSETPLLVKWLYAHRDVNLVDFEPFRRNQVRVYVAEDSTGILGFFPIQSVFMFDAFAPRPDTTESQIVQSIRAMHEFLIAESKKLNVGKILLQPSDARFSKFLQEQFKYKSSVHETLVLKVTPTESTQCPE